MITKITLNRLSAQSYLKNATKTGTSFDALFKEARYTAVVYGKLSMVAASQPKTEKAFRKLIGAYYGASFTTDYPYTIEDKSTRNKIALVAKVPYAFIYFTAPKKVSGKATKKSKV